MRTLAFVLATLVLTGCTLNTDYFGEYRGKNLLGNKDFGATGAWVVPTTAAPYVTWEAIGTAAHPSDTAAGTPTTGPDLVSPAYRLEIKNLIPDGDFESETSGANPFTYSFWTRTTGSSLVFGTTPATPTSSVALDNQSVYWTTGSTGDSLTLMLSDTAGTAGALDTAGFSGSTALGAYRFRADYYNVSSVASSLPLKINFSAASGFTADGAGNWQTTLATGRDSFSFGFSLSGLLSEPTTTVQFGGSSSVQALVLDNVRLVRTDLDTSAVLTLPSLSSGTLPLLPGSKSGAYAFSFFVRDDPTAGLASTAPGFSSNRMHPSGLTLTVLAAVKSGSGTFQHFYPRASAWSGWTKITVPLGFDFVDLDSQLAASGLTSGNAFIVKLTPTNTYDDSTSGPDAGSLLVAQPVLVYNP